MLLADALDAYPSLGVALDDVLPLGSNNIVGWNEMP